MNYAGDCADHYPFLRLEICDTDRNTVFFYSLVRLYGVSFEVNYYSVCRDSFAFECFRYTGSTLF